MATLLEWSDSDSVKIVVLDDQHKKLFDLTNELFTAMSARRGREVAGDILCRLLEYAAVHFEAEEKLMEEHQYPELDSHRGEHKAMREKVLAFQKAFDDGDNNVPPQLLVYLQLWLRNHLRRVDQQYSDFLNARGVQ